MAAPVSFSTLVPRPRSSANAAQGDLASAQFRDFYGALAAACQAVRQLGEADAEVASRALSDQLLQLIELQTLEAHRIGGRSGVDAEGHARYLKAALADERLIATEWAGRPYWRPVLLEARLFNTSLAGEKVFEEIDRLLAQRDPVQRPVARLYLSALSLGFQGRYRASATLAPVADYRRELFQFIFQREPDLQGRERTVSPAAYASTLSHVKPRRLPRLSRGVVVLVLTLLALLAVSQVLWLWQSWPVRQAVDAVALSGRGEDLLC